MLKTAAVTIVYSWNKRFLDVETMPTEHKQTNIRPKFFKQHQLPFEKKTGPGQIQTQDLCRPGVFFTTRLSVQEILQTLNYL